MGGEEAGEGGLGVVGGHAHGVVDAFAFGVEPGGVGVAIAKWGSGGNGPGGGERGGDLGGAGLGATAFEGGSAFGGFGGGELGAGVAELAVGVAAGGVGDETVRVVGGGGVGVEAVEGVVGSHVAEEVLGEWPGGIAPPGSLRGCRESFASAIMAGLAG